jgi:hypothetical protein
MVLVAPTFHSDGVSAELRRREDGCEVRFIRPRGCHSEYFSRDTVRGDIGARAVKNEGNVVRYVESCLRAAGYGGISRRPTVVNAEIAAVWDLMPSRAA